MTNERLRSGARLLAFHRKSQTLKSRDHLGVGSNESLPYDLILRTPVTAHKPSRALMKFRNVIISGRFTMSLAEAHVGLGSEFDILEKHFFVLKPRARWKQYEKRNS